MFVFSSVGISLISLLLYFFHPHNATLQNFPHQYNTHIISQSPNKILVQSRAIFVTPTPTSEITSSPPVTNPEIPTTEPDNTVQAYIMQAINEYRTSLGLAAVTPNDRTCTFAKVRAQEITTNFSHDGFNQRIQNHTLPYPNYALVTENIAETSNFQEVVPMWKNSPGHAANMRADTPYICVEQYGNYYAFEGWKPL